MDVLKRAFLAAEQFNDYGKGLLIKVVQQKAVGVVYKGMPLS